MPFCKNDEPFRCTCARQPGSNVVGRSGFLKNQNFPGEPEWTDGLVGGITRDAEQRREIVCDETVRRGDKPVTELGLLFELISQGAQFGDVGFKGNR